MRMGLQMDAPQSSVAINDNKITEVFLTVPSLGTHVPGDSVALPQAAEGPGILLLLFQSAWFLQTTRLLNGPISNDASSPHDPCI